jgi:hypothetical protein
MTKPGVRWLALDCRFRQHPKVALAGYWGAQAAQAAWELAKALDMPDGDVSRYWRADYLRAWLQLPQDCADDLAEGMRAAEDVGLIECRDGRYYIHDWSDWQTQSMTAVRQQRHRDRERSAPIDVTLCHAMSRDDDHNVTLSRDVTKGVTEMEMEMEMDQSAKRAIPGTPYPDPHEQSTTTDEDYALADAHRELAVRSAPDHRLSSVIAYDQVRAEHARQMADLRRSGKSTQDIRDVMAWAFADPHWSSVVQKRPAKLDEHWDTISAQRRTRTAGRARASPSSKPKCIVTREEIERRTK